MLAASILCVSLYQTHYVNQSLIYIKLSTGLCDLWCNHHFWHLELVLHLRGEVAKQDKGAASITFC